MPRREAAAAVAARIVERNPRPLLVALQGDRELSKEEVRRLHADWVRAWGGAPPVPLIVLQPGVSLTAVAARPRSVIVRGFTEETEGRVGDVTAARLAPPEERGPGPELVYTVRLLSGECCEVPARMCEEWPP